MSSRTALRLGASAILFALVAGCTDRPTQVHPRAAQSTPLHDIDIPNCNTTLIEQYVDMLAPKELDDPPLDLTKLVKAVFHPLKDNQLALAQQLVIGLAGVLSNDAVLNELNTPPPPTTKGQAISGLLNLLFVCVQLPPPGDISGAFGPGGGAKVIGSAGGSLLTRDNGAGTLFPPGAISGNHLVAIQPLTADAASHTCLPTTAMITQVDQCYDYSITPVTTFAIPVTNVICSFAIGTPYGPPTAEIHDNLHIASIDHTDPTKIKVFDRVADPFALDCSKQTLPTGSLGLGDRMLGKDWPKLTRLVAAVTRPFRPTPAYASDGIGGLVSPGYTHFTTVYPIALKTGFEQGDAAWTTTGFWNQSTLVGITNTAAATYCPPAGFGAPCLPPLVSLGAGDNSGGALPAPHGGSYAMWYGQPASGNYIGTLSSTNNGAYSGGTSTAANSGTVTSPSFAVPNTTNPITLTFASWYEIEGVNPSSFDLMDVRVVGPTGAITQVAQLNPAADPTSPAQRAPLPFTSGGFDVAPVWQSMAVDLSAYKGTTIQLQFSFDTRDVFYNGFRGWIFDDVLVKVAPLSSSVLTSRSFTVPLNLNVVPGASAGPRVWHP